MNCCSKLGHSHSFHVLLFQSSQIYEAIRANADRLIKIRREGEPNLQHVTFTDPVQRTAVPHQELTWCTVRCTGVRGHHCPSAFLCSPQPLFLASHGHAEPACGYPAGT